MLDDATAARESFIEALNPGGTCRCVPSAHSSNAPWTYFVFAEAHQWLLLGRPERVWSTLD